MNDDEKRRIADVIFDAMPKEERRSVHAFLFFRDTSDDLVWTEREMASVEWQAFGAVMDWVHGLGCLWSYHEDIAWELWFRREKVGACLDEVGERWARLSCVAQAIEAGVIE